MAACTSLVAVFDGLAQSSPVAQVAGVIARNAQGDISTFVDPTGTEFAVTYDDRRRVISVVATNGFHASDIAAVNYDARGGLVGVVLGSGDRLSFDHTPDGEQPVSADRGKRGTLASQSDERNAQLGASAEAIQALLSALAPSASR